MSTQQLCVAAARQHLCVGRKSLSVPQSLDLAVQVSAVDLGLKPALLYDANGADPEQVRRYLVSLQSSGVVSGSLLTVALDSNALVVNPVAAEAHLEAARRDGGPVVIDVRGSLEKPAVIRPLTGELESLVQDLLLLLKERETPQKAWEPAAWNLCTVFGLVLGYPVTYWFDQNESFENCLSMTPLTVTTATAKWRTDASERRRRLYAFSVPTLLRAETRPDVDAWRLRLEESFQRQEILTDLQLCSSSVTLPAVCL